MVLVVLSCLTASARVAAAECAGTFFPIAGDGLDVQSHKKPAQLGMRSTIVKDLRDTVRSYPGCTIKPDARWALWRHGYLVHVEGNFTQASEIKSARKTIHAATVGALIHQKKIGGSEKALALNVAKTWNEKSGGASLDSCDADATLKHVLTQTSGYQDAKKCPGEKWHYSDLNPPVLNNVAVRAVLGDTKRRFDETPTFYRDTVLKPVLFDRLGASKSLDAFPATWAGEDGTPPDGIRIKASLSDLGRFAVLMANDGKWKSEQVIPKWYVLEMAKLQTMGSEPESPYGFMTWTNAKRETHPGRSPKWATASGAGGHYITWNRDNGIALVILDSGQVDGRRRCIFPADTREGGGAVQLTPAIDKLEASLEKPNPLAGKCVP